MKLPVSWVLVGRNPILGCLALAVSVLAVGSCRKPAPAVAVLANPGFEQPLDSGWTQSVVNDTFSRGFIERSDTLGQPDSGFAVRVYKFAPQRASLGQTIALDTIGQVLRFTARFRFGGNVLSAPVAAVSLSYLDRAGSRLGRTLLELASTYSILANSDSVHLIAVTDTTAGWRQYAVNIQNELDSSLAAVERSAVKQLRVELTAWAENHS
jgi:hypothetical protein